MMFARLAATLLATSLVAAAASAGELPAPVAIDCTPVVAARGSTAAVQITLSHGNDVEVAGMQNDLEFDPLVFSITPANCVINPAIADDPNIDKTLSTSVLGDPVRVRNIVLSLENVNTIPNGLLYTCTFGVAAETDLGEYQLGNTHIVASAPDGTRLPVEGSNCVITVAEATPTPTPVGFCNDNQDCPDGQVCVDHRCVTPTPSPTPIGFCNDNQDCPDGQVCVDHHCVTPTPIGFCNDNEDCPDGQICVNHHCVTPTPSPTPIGFCTSTDDCPPGQVCVNNMCVAVTPTRKSGGGGGCNCAIDPRDRMPRAGDALAVLLPALVLLLRRRARVKRLG